MVQLSASAAQKAQNIGDINRQLLNEFHPAVKNVASAGHNLLRAYENLSRNFYVYTASLYALSYSAPISGGKVHESAKQLEKISEAMKTMHAEQIKWMDYFTAMTMTVNRNCKSEKERLKRLQAAFSERERDLHKEVDKGRQMPTVLEHFYETELNEMQDQQMQRYRFFVDKHADLLRRYMDWMHFSTELLEKDPALFERAEHEQGMAEKGQRQLLGGRDSDQNGGGEEARRGSLGGTTTESGGSVRAEVNAANDGIVHFRNRSVETQRQSVDEKEKSRRSTFAESREQIQAQITRGAEAAETKKKRREFPPNIFRPTPILPAALVANREQKYRHSLAEAMLSASTGEVWTTDWADKAPTQQQEALPRATVAPLLQHFYSESPTGESEEDQFSERLPPKSQRKSRLTGNFAPKISPVVEQKPLIAVPSTTSSNESPVPPQMGHHHVRGQSQESSGSGVFARYTPTVFLTSDNGREVECTHAYEAQGENQLSMLLAERVVLLKSGTRGWVLCRSRDGNRHGWFPAKYLKLV